MSDFTSGNQAAANKVGYWGTETDPTPNENYTVKGVTSGKPTPETDPEAKAAAIARTNTPLGDAPNYVDLAAAITDDVDAGPSVEYEATVPGVAAGSDDVSEVFEVDEDGTVAKVTYTPETDIVGANVNNRSLVLVNLGQDGNGNTEVARLNLVAAAGTLANGDAKPITLSGTPANLAVKEGDTLEWRSTHVGTGIADPGGLLIVRVND